MTLAVRPAFAKMTPTAVQRVTTRCVQELRRQEPAAESAHAVEPHQQRAVVQEIVEVRVPMDAGVMNPAGASRIAAAMSALCVGSATVFRSRDTVALLVQWKTLLPPGAVMIHSTQHSGWVLGGWVDS